MNTSNSADIHAQRILIIDYGSQYTQLIARRVREIGVYCEIYSWDSPNAIQFAAEANGIILSGGPESVTSNDTPVIPDFIIESKLPILGICYGMQALVAKLGGEVSESKHKEFGFAQVTVQQNNKLFEDINDGQTSNGQRTLDVWMSHGDKVTTLPKGFLTIASTPNAEHAAIADESRDIYGLQFHPEVTHTKKGKEILTSFVLGVCACDAKWVAENIIESIITQVRATVGKDHVILGLSGGVDSSVVAAILHEAVGDQLTCIFVDTGLLRLHEGDQVEVDLTDYQLMLGEQTFALPPLPDFARAIVEAGGIVNYVREHGGFPEVA